MTHLRTRRNVKPQLVELESREVPAIFTVTNTGDNGGVDPTAGANTGTLRQAIVDANVNPDVDNINFNISGTGPHKITLSQELPRFKYAAIVDGYTQKDAQVNTLSVGNNAKIMIEIDGSGKLYCISNIGGGDTNGLTVRGLSIVNFQFGISDDHTSLRSNYVIEGNFIGVRPDGVTKLAGQFAGIELIGVTGSRIGGPSPASRNVIGGWTGFGVNLVNGTYLFQNNYVGTNASGSLPIPNGSEGVVINDNTGSTISNNVISGNGRNGLVLGNSSNLTVTGNLIGTNSAGTAAIPNTLTGLLDNGHRGGTIIGGPNPTDRNLISGNLGSGMFINGSEVSLVVQNNYIGTDITGQQAIPKNLHGISTFLSNGATKLVTYRDNVISGNVQDGINAPGLDSLVQGNKIGVAADGVTPLGNGRWGIAISERNIIGTNSLNPGVGNIIAFNGSDGVRGSNDSGIVNGNSIYSNGGLGINSNAGSSQKVTITNVTTTATTITIAGAITSTTGVHRLEFYANPEPVGGELPEGKQYLGFANYTLTNSPGAFNVTINAVLPANMRTVTALTTVGNFTTDFSNGITPLPPPVTGGTVSGVVFNDANGNATQDNNEGGVGGVTVFFDSNGDGSPAGEVTALTNSQGAYTLTLASNLIGSPRIVVPSGQTQTTTNPGIANISNGVSITGVVFGIRVPPPPVTTGRINGVVYVDTNRSGTQDNFEPAFGGVNVFVDLNRNGSLDNGEPSIISSATQRFSITLQTGQYQVRAIPVSNRPILSPNPVEISILNGAETVLAFGVAPESTQPPGNQTGTTVLIGHRQFAVGSDRNLVGTAKLYNPDGTARQTVQPFGESFQGGVRVASADFNQDGVADLVVGTGPGTASNVKVLDGVNGKQLFTIDPFEATFVGGVYVTAGDVQGDGIPELIISPDEGGGPRIRVFNGRTFTQIADFFGIDDPAFRGGARGSVGDFNGDTVGDLVVAAGFGGGPRVAVFNGLLLTSTGGPKLFGDLFVFEPALTNGAFITVGDLNGDGIADLFAGGGPGGGPRVSVFDGRALLSNSKQTLTDFFAGSADNRGGVRLAVKNLDDDRFADVVIGSGTGAGSRVSAYLGKNFTTSGPTGASLDFDAFAGYLGGVFVG